MTEEQIYQSVHAIVAVQGESQTYAITTVAGQLKGRFSHAQIREIYERLRESTTLVLTSCVVAAAEGVGACLLRLMAA